MLMLHSLHVKKELFVQDSNLTHVYSLSGNLCSTDAIWLKNTFQEFTYSEDIIVDLSQVQKTDLTAINALAQGHKKHRLTVILPVHSEAAELFHLTKFTSILTTLPSMPAYHEGKVFA